MIYWIYILYTYIYIYIYTRIWGPPKAVHINKSNTLIKIHVEILKMWMFENVGVLNMWFGVLGVFCVMNHYFEWFYEIQWTCLYIGTYQKYFFFAFCSKVSKNDKNKKHISLSLYIYISIYIYVYIDDIIILYYLCTYIYNIIYNIWYIIYYVHI